MGIKFVSIPIGQKQGGVGGVSGDGGFLRDTPVASQHFLFVKQLVSSMKPPDTLPRSPIRVLLIGVCLLALAPALLGMGVAADGGGEDQSATAQSLVIDGLIDAVFGEDADEEAESGGVFEMIFGDDEPTFDGYPDGFSEDGIEDFDQALGTESTHYNADSLTMEGEIDTPEGTFSVTMRVSGDEERMLMKSETPDDTEAVQYLAAETRYTATDGDFSQREDSFDRDMAYGVTEFLEPVANANLTESEIEGDTVIYTAADSEIELAVRDTGELEFLHAERDGQMIELTFDNYGDTTIMEPDWIDEAEKQSSGDDVRVPERGDRPDEPTDRIDPEPPREERVDQPIAEPDSEPPANRETMNIVSDEPGDIRIEVPDEGELVVEPGEQRIVTVEPDEDHVASIITPTERYEERFTAGVEYHIRIAPAGESVDDRTDDSAELRAERERLSERLEWVEEEIAQIESGDRDRDHSDTIEELRRDIERNQDAIDELTDRLEELEAGDDRDIEQEIATLKDDLAQRQERADRLRDRMEDTDDPDRLQRLETWYEDVTEDIDRIENQIERLESGGSDRDDDIAQIRDRIDAHEERIDESRDRIEALEERDRQEDRLDELAEHREELVEEIDRIEERLEQVGE